MGFEPIQTDQAPAQEPVRGFTPLEQEPLPVSEIPNGQQIIDANNAWLQGIVSPEMSQNWKDSGTIGVGEAWSKLNKWEMIPFLNAKTLLDDVPVIKSFSRVRDGEILSSEEKDTMREYILDMAEIQTRGYSLGGKITDAALRMPAYMGEIAVGVLTGGAAVPALVAKQTAKTGAKTGVKQFVKTVIKKTGKIAGLGAATTAVMPHRITKMAVNDHLNDSLAITDKGRVFIKEAEKSPAEYAMRALGNVYIENFSEFTGGALLTPIVKRVGGVAKRVLPKGFITGFKNLAEKTTNKPIKEAIEKFGGWNGLIEEIGEERVADLLKTSFDLDPEQGYSTDQFLGAIFPDREDFLVEVGVLSIFGGVSRATQALGNKLRSRGITEKDIEVALANLSETEREAALATLEEIDQTTPEAELEEIRQSLAELEGLDVSEFDQQQIAEVDAQIEAKTLELEGLESVVEQRLSEIAAREGKNILPVPKKPETLSQFLKKAGGLKIDTAEARKFTRKESPGLKGVANKNGTLSLDEARRLAVEAGFIEETGGEGVTESDIDSIVEALEQEALGAEVVRGGDISDLEIREQIIEFNRQQDELNQEILAAAKNITTFRQSFKEGVRAAKLDVKAVQKVIRTALKKTDLSAEDRDKFADKITNIQTVEQLRKAAPDIQKRVERLLNAEAVKKQKDILEKLFSPKEIKARIQAGKKVGKFDAETQVRLEELKQLRSLKKEDAQAELDKRIEEGSTDALANRILNIKANPSDISPSEISTAITEIRALLQFGKAEAAKRLSLRKRTAEEVRSEMDAFIETADPEVLTRKQTGFKALARTSRQALRSGFSLLAGSWGEIIDRVAPRALVGELGIRREISKQKEIMRVMGEKLVQSAHDAFEMEKTKDLLNELERGNQIKDLGIFVNMRGESVRIELSRSQARKLWMELQNTDIKEKTLQTTEGNAYTDEMLDAMLGILTEQDFAFAEKQLDIYEDFYDQINEVYRRVFGIDLPKAEFYSPIAREVDLKDVNADIFLRETNFRRALATGSALKLREKNAVSALKRRSDIDVYNSHIAQMSRFIAFREKTQLLDDVFGNAALRRKIKLSFGKFLDREITENLQFISGTGKATQTIIDKGIDYLNRNFATAQLGAKAKIGLTQIASYPMYAEFIPSGALLKGTADFVLNHKKAIKILGNTELMLDRGANEDLDVAKMGKTFDNAFIERVKKGKANLIDYLLIFTKFGDRAAIYAGGWAVYKHNIDQGKTHEQAIAAFEDATASTQQSKDPDQVSFLQRTNAVTRGLTMFMTAPIAQFRGEVRIIRRFKKGEITETELAKGLIIYHVLVPQIYQALAGGILVGEIDEDDQLRALMFGSLAGVPIIGDVINTAFREAQGKFNQPKDIFKWSATMKDAFVNAYDALIAGTEGDFDDAITSMIELAKDATELAGLPVDQAERIISGVEDLETGDIKKGALKITGFPKSVSGK